MTGWQRQTCPPAAIPMAALRCSRTPPPRHAARLCLHTALGPVHTRLAAGGSRRDSCASHCSVSDACSTLSVSISAHGLLLLLGATPSPRDACDFSATSCSVLATARIPSIWSMSLSSASLGIPCAAALGEAQSRYRIVTHSATVRQKCNAGAGVGDEAMARCLAGRFSITHLERPHDGGERPLGLLIGAGALQCLQRCHEGLPSRVDGHVRRYAPRSVNALGLQRASGSSVTAHVCEGGERHSADVCCDGEHCRDDVASLILVHTTLAVMRKDTGPLSMRSSEKADDEMAATSRALPRACRSVTHQARLPSAAGTSPARPLGLVPAAAAATTAITTTKKTALIMPVINNKSNNIHLTQ